LRVISPELSRAKIMAWMTMWPCVADVEQPGRLTPISESVKTSSARAVACTEPWSSSTALKSASLGRVSLIRQPSPSQSLTASQSYLALDLVDTQTAPTPIMS
jgi:hypothetical protein